jgi:cold shock CspA family protein
MSTGTLHTWKPDRGFGFIRPDDGSHDVFAHITGFGDRRQPSVGDRLEYETRLSDRNNKPEAFNIRVAS